MKILGTFGNSFSFAALLLGLSFCSGQKSQEDIFTLAWESAPRTLDPRYALDANSQYLENLLHCALVDFDKTGATRAQLAREWKWVKPNVLELSIHEGVLFSDGTPVGVDDVIATYEFFQIEEKDPSPRKGFMTGVERVEKVSDSSLRFTLKEADVSFVTNLVVGILPKSKALGARIKDVGQSVGCGPFKIAKNDLNGIVLEKNTQYFKKENLPQLEKVQIKIVQDESTRYAKLLKGEIDFVQNGLNREKLAGVEKDHASQLKVQSQAGLNVTYLGFNMRDKVVQSKELRQAISLAIDRQVIVDKVLQGRATLAKTLLTPQDPMLNASISAIEVNLEKAKELLDKAGFKDPDGDGPKSRLQLSYKTTTNTTRVTIAKAVASQLKKIGIDVEVQSLEWGKFKEDIEKGRAQIWSLSWIGFKDPDIFRYVFASESFPPNGGNRGWYSNQKLDSLLSQGRSESDFEKRKSIYAQVQEIIADELPYVFLWHEENFAVLNSRYEGFELFADGRLYSLTKLKKSN